MCSSKFQEPPGGKKWHFPKQEAHAGQPSWNVIGNLNKGALTLDTICTKTNMAEYKVAQFITTTDRLLQAWNYTVSSVVVLGLKINGNG